MKKFVSKAVSLLSHYYERAILIVVALLAFIFLAWLLVRVNNIETQFKEEKGPTNIKAVGPVDLQKLQAAQALLENPPTWSTNNSHRLFIADWMKVLEPQRRYPKHSDPKTDVDKPSPEGFPYWWLKKYNFSTTKSVGMDDPDEDGFNNLEEYKAETNPTDANSKPDVAKKLRIDKVFQKDFPFRFVAYVGAAGDQTYTITRWEDKAQYFHKEGEEILDKKYPGYRVGKFHGHSIKQPNPNIRDRDGNPTIVEVDVSELTLQKGQEAPIILILNKPGSFKDLYVTLYFLIDKRDIEVKEKTLFSLKDVEYQVISVTKNNDMPVVKVKRTDLSTAEEITIPMLSPEERKTKAP